MIHSLSEGITICNLLFSFINAPDDFKVLLQQSDRLSWFFGREMGKGRDY